MPELLNPVWQLRSRLLDLSQTPVIMGIVNTTPDSFSDGGRFLDPSMAVDHALQLVAEGAGILDVGGESTRPGATAVPENEEVRRVIPVIEQIVLRSRIPVSVDTTKSEVARLALAAGAEIVNDISGLTFDPRMPDVCAAGQAGVLCMHIQGTPQTMQQAPHYTDVVADVATFLRQRLEELRKAGIPANRVAFDPGIGFGKTADHNIQLLRQIRSLRHLGRPLCMGHSRKRFLRKLLGREVDERLFGTVGVSVAAALQGAELIRVHDVAASRDAITACRACLPEEWAQMGISLGQ
jgi:dihydropteroate synthase